MSGNTAAIDAMAKMKEVMWLPLIVICVAAILYGLWLKWREKKEADSGG